MSEAFAPYGVALELFQFEGSFLSLAIDLPDELYETFAKDELIGLSGAIVAEESAGRARTADLHPRWRMSQRQRCHPRPQSW